MTTFHVFSGSVLLATPTTLGDWATVDSCLDVSLVEAWHSGVQGRSTDRLHKPKAATAGSCIFLFPVSNETVPINAKKTFDIFIHLFTPINVSGDKRCRAKGREPMVSLYYKAPARAMKKILLP